LTEIQADSFADLGSLEFLGLGFNPIEVLHGGAFRGLANITTLECMGCRLRQLNANAFEGAGNLRVLYLDLNEIEDLPPGVFVPLSNIRYISLWYNRLNTLRRNSFGTLTSLESLNLNSNYMNGLDRAIIDDAVNLNTLYFLYNSCAHNYSENFANDRPQFLELLDRCFTNFRFIINTVTQGDDAFSFFEGRNPGIVVRVNASNEVQIALSPLNVLWNPVIEIFIGTANNTRSVIRMNQQTNVVTVPTPNILIRDQWNDFRITWQYQVISVFSGNDTFPFMSFTMQDWVPVNFYALRSVETTASWSVQPLDG